MFEIESVVNAMRRQEDLHYQRTEPFQYWSNRSDTKHFDSINFDSEVYHDCRSKMITWSFEIIDFCKLDRETVEIALSYLDRYVLTPEGSNTLIDRTEYQLACMGSLYTAIKIHESRVLSSETLSKLSHGLYNSKQIESMEYELLHALQWHMNPPTSVSFARQWIEMLPNEVFDDETKEYLLQSIKIQTEACLKDSLFLTSKASTLAYIALLNALNQLEGSVELIELIDDDVKSSFMYGGDETSVHNELCNVTNEAIRLLLVQSIECTATKIFPRIQNTINRKRSYESLRNLENSPRSSTITATISSERNLTIIEQ